MKHLGITIAGLGGIGTIGSAILLSLHDRSNVALVMHEWGHAWHLDDCEEIGCIMNEDRAIHNLVELISNLAFCSNCEQYLKRATRGRIGDGLIIEFNYSGNSYNIAEMVYEKLMIYGIDGMDVVRIEHVDEHCINPEYGYIERTCILSVLNSHGVDYNKYKRSRLMAQINDRPMFDFGPWGKSIRANTNYYQVCFSPLNHAKLGFLSATLIPLGILLAKSEKDRAK